MLSRAWRTSRCEPKRPPHSDILARRLTCQTCSCFRPSPALLPRHVSLLGVACSDISKKTLHFPTPSRLRNAVTKLESCRRAAGLRPGQRQDAQSTARRCSAHVPDRARPCRAAGGAPAAARRCGAGAARSWGGPRVTLGYMAARLRQREDGDLVLRVVWQVLVQVGQAVWVAAQLVVHHTQLVARRHLPARPCRPRAHTQRPAPA